MCKVRWPGGSSGTRMSSQRRSRSTWAYLREVTSAVCPAVRSRGAPHRPCRGTPRGLGAGDDPVARLGARLHPHHRRAGLPGVRLPPPVRPAHARHPGPGLGGGASRRLAPRARGMTRLILLNGPPGVGKSTLAARYAGEHPGTLCLDIDVLRTMVGGWADDYARTGALVRPAALGLLTAYLRESGDVVLPQLISRETELAR